MANRRAELATALDHPIFFSLVVTLVVMAWMGIITWFAKSANIPGLAALSQHP